MGSLSSKGRTTQRHTEGRQKHGSDLRVATPQTFSLSNASLAGALAYESDGSHAHLVFQLRPGAYNDESLIELNELEQRRPVVLIGTDCPRATADACVTGLPNSAAG